MTADDNGTQDLAAEYDGKGQEWVLRDGRDSRVAIMAVADNKGSGSG
jgi:hypothetical protein